MKNLFLTFSFVLAMYAVHAQTPVNDADLVHKTGQETIDGHKTFQDGLTTLGPVYIPYANTSSAGNYKILTRNQTNGLVEFVDPVALANGGTFDDSDVLHKSLDETIIGPKHFNAVTYFNGGIIASGGLYTQWLSTSETGNYRILTVNKATSKVEAIDASSIGGGGSFNASENQTITGSWNFTGNLGIGMANPQDKLAVNGRVRAKEVKVEAANWPDYVFEENYKMLSLSDLEKFIQTNKHLPEIPSAKEAEESGIDLGEMNAKLLKKIEELTLHLIQKNKEIEALQLEMQEIRVLLSTLPSPEREK